jgi:phosphoglycolate phosphatase-like HAD superfamily hydrolase
MTASTLLPNRHDDLTGFTPRRDFFVGIDSDGCAFDAMEIKHKECFIPATITTWNLQAASSVARETWEFVLYSVTRGQNRWVALVTFFDLLRDRREVRERGVQVPKADGLRAFLKSGLPLSAEGLKTFSADRLWDGELATALRWSANVDRAIAATVTGVPPFRGVEESLIAMQGQVDLMVVSATPLEALRREWAEHGLDRYMDVIAGQELGVKTDHLQRAAKGKYPDHHILLIGDAPGDRDAAAAQEVLFYPILPGRETYSWARFHSEALPRLLAGRYDRTYQKQLLDEFAATLPSTPPWLQTEED